MIDRQRRDEYADAIDAFLEGSLGGTDYADLTGVLALGNSKAEEPDLAVAACQIGLYEFHPPSRRHGIARSWAGPRHASDLPQAQWDAFDRCRVFLRSDRELAWPSSAWAARDVMENPPDILTLLVTIVAAICGMAAILLLACRQWIIGPVLALATAGFAFLAVRLRQSDAQEDQAEQAQMLSPYGDATAFPFTSHEECRQERKRQGYTAVGPATEVDES